MQDDDDDHSDLFLIVDTDFANSSLFSSRRAIHVIRGQRKWIKHMLQSHKHIHRQNP